MGDISDKELRTRLLAFNTVVPPVTGSTRNLLLKKLADLEKNQVKQNAASKIMPPPSLKSPINESVMISSSNNGQQSQHIIFDNMDSPRKGARRRRQYRAPDPFDTSDSEVDTGSLGHIIQPANPKIASSSPKSNETSLMNVSNWKNTADLDAHQSYLSPGTQIFSNTQTEVQPKKIIPNLFDSKINKTSASASVIQKPHTTLATKNPSHADQAIQRWKEKMMNQSQDKDDASQFNSPSPIPKVFTHNLRKNIQYAQKMSQRNNDTKNTQRQYIILLFVGFFVGILGLYFISVQSSTVVLPPDILNSLCAKKNLQGSDCDIEQAKVQRLYNSLVSQLQDKYIKNHCEKSNIEPTVDAQTVFEYITTRENLPSREIEELIELFKSIAKTYSDSPIGFDTSFKNNIQPNLPIMCALKQIFSNVFYLFIWLGIVALCVICLYFAICYITSKSEKYKQEVNQLIENTINLLKDQANNRTNGESYLPIIHIRDSLIPTKERQAKTKIWAEVVQYFTESESCVRSEVQEIDGEDFQVWRWVEPMSPGK